MGRSLALQLFDGEAEGPGHMLRRGARPWSYIGVLVLPATVASSNMLKTSWLFNDLIERLLRSAMATFCCFRSGAQKQQIHCRFLCREATVLRLGAVQTGASRAACRRIQPNMSTVQTIARSACQSRPFVQANSPGTRVIVWHAKDDEPSNNAVLSGARQP